MSARQNGTQAGGRKTTGNSGGANGEDGRYPATGPLSWYFAQRRVTGLRYVLTINGHVLL